MKQNPDGWIPDAIQNALAINPEVVLSESWPDYFTIRGYICTVTTDDYDNYGDAVADLNERVSAVKRVSRLSLKRIVAECLASFEKTKSDLAHFYKSG